MAHHLLHHHTIDPRKQASSGIDVASMDVVPPSKVVVMSQDNSEEYYPTTLSTTGTASFSESEEDDASPCSAKSTMTRSEKGLAAHFHDDIGVLCSLEQRSEGSNYSNTIVVVEVPFDLPFLTKDDNNESDRSRSNGRGIWSLLRPIAANRWRPQERRHPCSFSWDEDHLSSSAVLPEEEEESIMGWDLENDFGLSEKFASPCRMKIVSPKKSPASDETQQRPKLRYCHSLPLFLTGKRHRLQAAKREISSKKRAGTWSCPQTCGKTSFNMDSIDPASSPSATFRKKQITSARREQLGFARIVAMDGILESISDRPATKPTPALSSQTPSLPSESKPTTVSPPFSRPKALLHSPKFALDRTDDVPSYLVWV